MMARNSRIFIYSLGVHVGGGAILQKALLDTDSHIEKIFLVADERFKLENSLPQNRVKFIRNSIIGRLYAEYFLYINVKNDDVVLCLGNLPPLFKLPGKVFVFLQNRFLVDSVFKVAKLPLNAIFNILLKKIWLRIFSVNSNCYLVQTQSMRLLAEMKFTKEIRCIPFFPKFVYKNEKLQQNNYDFIYVATGEAHKNHEKLIGAWKILADYNQYPSLALTLSDQDEKKLLKNYKLAGLKIINLGVVDNNKILEIYRKSRALIYPSEVESFAIPLVEARNAGLPIVAAELDYVRDTVDPVETFDPKSSRSIARAVMRFLKVKTVSVDVCNAEQFFEKILKG